MHYIYILSCNDGTLYTGWTTDLTKRLAVHNAGKGAKYTRSRLPVKMVYYESFRNQSDALRRECEIKKMSKSEKLRLIQSKTAEKV